MRIKSVLTSGLTALLVAGLMACGKDNYAPPQSSLTGKIVYKGEPVNVEYNNVTFELWEPGWQIRTPIIVTVAQDGSYSALLFDATYKLYFQPSQGPFRTIRKENSDTTVVNLRGSQTMDIDVMPYYMVRKPTFTAASRQLSATCQIEKIITDANAKDVERVSLYVSQTQFVDSRTSVASQDLKGSDIRDLNAVRLEVALPTVTQNYVFARIGVKIAGVEDLIFSPVQKVQL